jgi:hypothetical protein
MSYGIIDSRTVSGPQPSFIKTSGDGTLTELGNDRWVLNLGNVQEGSTSSTALEVANINQIGEGTFSFQGSGFEINGPASVTAHGPPGTHNSISVSPDTSSLGMHASALTFDQTLPGAEHTIGTIYVVDNVVSPV